MTHEAATFTHPTDPPVAPISKWHPYSKWKQPIVERLKELHKTCSSRECAIRLSSEFNIPFSRNGVVGKLHRLGLTVSDKTEVSRSAPRAKRTEVPARTKRPVLTIVRTNGNSPNLKVVYSVEVDQAPLRSIPLAPLNLTLDQVVEVDGCRYIAGNGSPFLYCGHAKREGSSFCGGHHAICWLPPTSRNERARGWK